jgi:NADH-quinone oxidoreductase subunit E
MIKFSEEKLKEVKELISHYPEGKQKSALIPLLHVAQDEFGGWLDVPVMDYVAEILGILPIEVYEVATFYSMFNTKPVGKYLLEVCRTGPCMLNGSDQMIDYIKEKLGISEGETTTDGLFTLKPAECLGACGYAPMMQLGDFYQEHLTEAKIDQLISDCKDGKITLDEIQAYLSENVGRQARIMNRKQEPQVIGDMARVLVGR